MTEATGKTNAMGKESRLRRTQTSDDGESERRDKYDIQDECVAAGGEPITLSLSSNGAFLTRYKGPPTVLGFEIVVENECNGYAPKRPKFMREGWRRVMKTWSSFPSCL